MITDVWILKNSLTNDYDNVYDFNGFNDVEIAQSLLGISANIVAKPSGNRGVDKNGAMSELTVVIPNKTFNEIREYNYCIIREDNTFYFYFITNVRNLNSIENKQTFALTLQYDVWNNNVSKIFSNDYDRECHVIRKTEQMYEVKSQSGSSLSIQYLDKPQPIIKEEFIHGITYKEKENTLYLGILIENDAPLQYGKMNDFNQNFGELSDFDFRVGYIPIGVYKGSLSPANGYTKINSFEGVLMGETTQKTFDVKPNDIQSLLSNPFVIGAFLTYHPPLTIPNVYVNTLTRMNNETVVVEPQKFIVSNFTTYRGENVILTDQESLTIPKTNDPTLTPIQKNNLLGVEGLPVVSPIIIKMGDKIEKISTTYPGQTIFVKIISSKVATYFFLFYSDVREIYMNGTIPHIVTHSNGVMTTKDSYDTYMRNEGNVASIRHENGQRNLVWSLARNSASALGEFATSNSPTTTETQVIKNGKTKSTQSISQSFNEYEAISQAYSLGLSMLQTAEKFAQNERVYQATLSTLKTVRDVYEMPSSFSFANLNSLDSVTVYKLIPLKTAEYFDFINRVYKYGFVFECTFEDFLERQHKRFDYIQAIVNVTTITNIKDREAINSIFAKGVRIWYVDSYDEYSNKFNTNAKNLPLNYIEEE